MSEQGKVWLALRLSKSDYKFEEELLGVYTNPSAARKKCELEARASKMYWVEDPSGEIVASYNWVDYIAAPRTAKDTAGEDDD